MLTASEQEAKIPESALSPPGSHKLQGRRRSPLNQMLLRASSDNRQFRTKPATSRHGGGHGALGAQCPHPVPAGAELVLLAGHRHELDSAVLGILSVGVSLAMDLSHLCPGGFL